MGSQPCRILRFSIARLPLPLVAVKHGWLPMSAKKAYMCASTLGSSLYLGYGYDILSSSVARSSSGKGSCTGGVGGRSFSSSNCRCGGVDAWLSSTSSCHSDSPLVLVVSFVVSDSGVGVCSDPSSSGSFGVS